MNHVTEKLSGGDLRSDGMADEVVDFILQNLNMFDLLYEGLSESDDVVRGRTADALEKIARTKPEMLIGCLPELLQVAEKDKLPMVRWHVAMILGHLAVYEDSVGEITQTLLLLLEDRSVFVRSWAIVSLCIIGRKYAENRDAIIDGVTPLMQDRSIAIKSRALKALHLLTSERVPFPKGWIKSSHLSELESTA
jgi:HEAT repeat protein